MSHLDSRAAASRSEGMPTAARSAATRPYSDPPAVVAVTAIGKAEGSPGTAAALACAAADSEEPSLLIDVGGRPSRPTLLASEGARQLEGLLTATLPLRAAARGQICHLAVAADEAGLANAAQAASMAPGTCVVIHFPPMLSNHMADVIALSGVLLRADLTSARTQTGEVARNMMQRGLAIGVLKQRLGWVAERRALFGVLSPDSSDGLPSSLVRRLISPRHPVGKTAFFTRAPGRASVRSAHDA